MTVWWRHRNSRHTIRCHSTEIAAHYALCVILHRSTYRRSAQHILHYCISYFICFTSVGRIFVWRAYEKDQCRFRRLKRFGYTTCNITVSDLIDTSGRDLFRKLCSSEHSLHHLLPPEREYSNLRNRGHPYELTEYCTNLHKKSYHSIIVFVHLIFFI